MNTHTALIALLHKPELAGVYAVADSEVRDIFRIASLTGLNIWRVNCSHAPHAQALLSQIGQDLCFPLEYGENWDALADCLADLAWCPADGHVLLLRGLENLHKHERKAYEIFIDVLKDTSMSWGRDKVPFWALIENGAPDLPPMPT